MIQAAMPDFLARGAAHECFETAVQPAPRQRQLLEKLLHADSRRGVTLNDADRRHDRRVLKSQHVSRTSHLLFARRNQSRLKRRFGSFSHQPIQDRGGLETYVLKILSDA